MATNQEIIKKLECVESKLMGGEIDEIHTTVKEIKEILLDPEDGVIVRVKFSIAWTIILLFWYLNGFGFVGNSNEL